MRGNGVGDEPRFAVGGVFYGVADGGGVGVCAVATDGVGLPAQVHSEIVGGGEGLKRQEPGGGVGAAVDRVAALGAPAYPVAAGGADGRRTLRHAQPHVQRVSRQAVGADGVDGGGQSHAQPLVLPQPHAGHVDLGKGYLDLRQALRRRYGYGSYCRGDRTVGGVVGLADLYSSDAHRVGERHHRQVVLAEALRHRVIAES